MTDATNMPDRAWYESEERKALIVALRGQPPLWVMRLVHLTIFLSLFMLAGVMLLGYLNLESNIRSEAQLEQLNSFFTRIDSIRVEREREQQLRTDSIRRRSSL